MHQQSKLMKINVMINFEVNVVEMIKNKIQHKIHHTKIMSKHATNPLKNGCVTGNKK